MKPELWGIGRKGDFQSYWAAVRSKVTEPSCWPQMPTLEVQRAPGNAAKKRHPCRAGCLGVREATAHTEGDVVTKLILQKGRLFWRAGIISEEMREQFPSQKTLSAENQEVTQLEAKVSREEGRQSLEKHRGDPSWGQKVSVHKFRRD